MYHKVDLYQNSHKNNIMEELTSKKCQPCEGGVPPIAGDDITNYTCQLKTTWDVIEGKKIRKGFSYSDFIETMIFVNKVADLAEEEGHHPDMHVSYGKVEIEIWTHAIGGLSENDFILAAKIDAIE